MNQSSKGHHHGSKSSGPSSAKSGSKSSILGGIHKDWRFWTVCLMLLGIVLYVFSDNESIVPGSQPGKQVPAEADVAE